jgi:hypothetical protein
LIKRLMGQESVSLDDGRTRRDVLRGGSRLGILATAGAGLAELLSPTRAGADTQLPQLPATMILNALPPDAPPDIRAAIEAGCCIHYTRDVGHCGSGCPSGSCCYRVVSTGCGINEVTCVEVSCAEGNFTTGC